MYEADPMNLVTIPGKLAGDAVGSMSAWYSKRKTHKIKSLRLSPISDINKTKLTI